MIQSTYNEALKPSSTANPTSEANGSINGMVLSSLTLSSLNVAISSLLSHSLDTQVGIDLKQSIAKRIKLGDLPTHEQQSNCLKLFLRQPLCEDISFLFQSVDILNNDALRLSNFFTEEVVLELEVFVARGHFGDIDK